LKLPPRNSENNVIPHDHDEIDGQDGIIRRISPHHLVPDPVSGGKKISTMAFRPSSGANGSMSVDLEALIVAAGLDPKQYVANPQWVGAVRFTASDLRGPGLQVGYDPLPENPYHGGVWGNFSKSTQERLRNICQPFVTISA
jgi:hypothetical protein